MAGILGSMGNIVSVTFRAITEPFVRGVRDVTNNLNNLQNHARQAGNNMRRAIDDLHASTRRAGMGITQLGTMMASLVSLYAGRKLFDFTIKQAADFEYYELQYKILLGGIDKAKERMEELNRFNLFTPFQLEEIIKADKLLTAFGIRSAEALKLTGDAAAGAGQPIEDVAFWLGRIAAGDVGFGLMRLSEMSIVTRKQLEDMGLKFGKNNEYLGDFNVLMDKLFEHISKKYPDAMNQLSGTATGAFSNMMDALNLFGREIGFKALDSAKEAMNDLIQTIWRLREDGTLDRWAQNIGNVLNWVFGKIKELISNIEDIAARIGYWANFIKQHFDTITTVLRILVEVWLAWKLAVIATNIVVRGLMILEVLTGAMSLLAASTSSATVAQWALNIAMEANPIGIIITLVGLLILGIIEMVRNWDWAGPRVMTVLNFMYLGVLTLTWAVMGLLDGIARFVAYVTQWIPLVGDMFGALAGYTSSAFAAIRGEIDATVERINGYMAAMDKANAQAAEPPKAPTAQPIPTTIPGSGPMPKFSGLGSRETTSKKAGSQKDAVDLVEDAWKYKIDIAEAKAKIAENEQKKYKDNIFMSGAMAWRNSLYNLINVFKGNISALDQTIASTTGTVREKAEAKRMELLAKISDITKDIREKINNLVQEFNAPSGVNPTSLMEYRKGEMMSGSGFTVSGANFVFQLTEAPKTADDWKNIFTKSEKALANFVDNQRRRNGQK